MQFWKFSGFKQIKKGSCDTDFIYYCKGKSDRIAKSEKLFWFLMNLIAFVTAYIISVMQTDFWWLTCVFISNMFI